MSNRAVSYIRASDRNAGIHGSTFSRQREEIAKMLEKFNLELIQEFSDMKSAYTLERSGLQEALLFIGAKKNKIRYLIVEEMRTLSTNYENSMEIFDILDKHGVELIIAMRYHPIGIEFERQINQILKEYREDF